MFFSITRGYDDVQCPSLPSASAFFYNPVSLFFHLRKLCCKFASHETGKHFRTSIAMFPSFSTRFQYEETSLTVSEAQASTSNILGFVRAHISRKKLFTLADKHDKTLKQEINISYGFCNHASKGIQGLSFITYF